MNSTQINSGSPEHAPRILCADDEPAITTLLHRILKGRGFDVDVVNCGRGALDTLLTHPNRFALLISDHDMPGLTGLELVTCMREQGCMVPVLLFSSSLNAELERRYAAMGVAHRLHKPTDFQPLLVAIEEILEGRRHD
jgi:CheY-like chemotaxis protein